MCLAIGIDVHSKKLTSFAVPQDEENIDESEFCLEFNKEFKSTPADRTTLTSYSHSSDLQWFFHAIGVLPAHINSDDAVPRNVPKVRMMQESQCRAVPSLLHVSEERCREQRIHLDAVLLGYVAFVEHDPAIDMMESADLANRRGFTGLS